MATEETPPGRRRGSCCDLDIALAPGRAADTAELFKVLADPTRLSILATLRQAPGPVCICDFTAAYDLSQPTVSHHMGKLRVAGLVESHKEGIWVYYRAATTLPEPVGRLLDAALSCAKRPALPSMRPGPQGLHLPRLPAAAPATER